jgi:hypothetical protein
MKQLMYEESYKSFRLELDKLIGFRSGNLYVTLVSLWRIYNCPEKISFDEEQLLDMSGISGTFFGHCLSKLTKHGLVEIEFIDDTDNLYYSFPNIVKALALVTIIDSLTLEYSN